MRLAKLAAMAVVGMACATSAKADMVVDQAAKAEKLLKSGDSLGALAAMDIAVDQVWEKIPLTMRRVVLVDKVEGFGVYASRDRNVFRPKETIHIYTEPAGYRYGTSSLGNLEISLEVEITIKNGAGKEMPLSDPVAFKGQSRHRNRELYFMIDINPENLAPDKYEASIVMKDKNSTKKVEFEVSFEISQNV